MKNATFKLIAVLLLAFFLDCHAVFAQEKNTGITGLSGSAASFEDDENPDDPTSLRGSAISLDAINDSEGPAAGNATSLMNGNSVPLPNANAANDNVSGTTQVQGNVVYLSVFQRVRTLRKPDKRS